MSPFSTFLPTSFENQTEIESKLTHTLQISFHHKEEKYGCLADSKCRLLMATFSYLARLTRISSESSPSRSWHRHISSRHELKRWRSLIPNPPSSFHLQTSDHFTHVILFPKFVLPHKKSIGIRTTSFHTIDGIFIKDRQNTSILFNTELIKKI